MQITDEERGQRAEAIGDLLDEFATKNHVRVIKWEACQGKSGKVSLKEVMHEVAKIGALPPSLMIADHIRMLKGLKPVYMKEAFKRFGGDLISVTPNGRPNIGIDFASNALSGATQPTVANYIALTNNTLATAATTTISTIPWSSAQAADAAAGTTTGEYTALGVARHAATYAHTTGVASYTNTYTWTATGTVTSLQRAGNFGGSTNTTQSGTAATNILFLDNTFTATSLANTDQLTLTWTVNI